MWLTSNQVLCNLWLALESDKIKEEGKEKEELLIICDGKYQLTISQLAIVHSWLKMLYSHNIIIIRVHDCKLGRNE